VSERVVVVGAGVIGLSCAVRLLERGHDVAVVARDLPLETTSAVAAALWYPHRAYPFERVTAWARTTYGVLAGLADEVGSEDTGITLKRGTEVLRRSGPRPWWAEAVPALEQVTDLPAGYADGWSFVAPVVEMPVYLEWLRARVEELGGTLTRMALPALPGGAGVVVDAGGLGGRLFGTDGSVQPVRGQVAYVEQVGLDEWWLDAEGPTYVVPRAHDIVVGGTEEEGVWDRTFDAAAGKEMLARARELVPAIRRAQVLGTRVGLRPARPQVRLETEERDGCRVVHCYGHGGAGVTLSWGCADEVADLVGDPA
jgi:D-amino-acid oxidase